MAENPTPTPGEFQAGFGEGDQLAYGEATDLNEQLAAGDAAEEQIAANAVMGAPMPDAEFPVEYDDGDGEEFMPGSEEDDILFGEFDPELEGDITPRSNLPNRPVPNRVLRSLPLLSMLANDPSTPPLIRASYRLILQRLAAEQEQRFA